VRQIGKPVETDLKQRAGDGTACFHSNGVSWAFFVLDSHMHFGSEVLGDDKNCYEYCCWK